MGEKTSLTKQPCCGEFIKFKNIIKDYTESTFNTTLVGDSCIIDFDDNIPNKMTINYYPECEEDKKDFQVFDFNYCPFCGSKLVKG